MTTLKRLGVGAVLALMMAFAVSFVPEKVNPVNTTVHASVDCDAQLMFSYAVGAIYEGMGAVYYFTDYIFEPACGEDANWLRSQAWQIANEVYGAGNWSETDWLEIYQGLFFQWCFEHGFNPYGG